ncbi:MAG: pyruvate kinase [Spirochaetota bacterium]
MTKTQIRKTKIVCTLGPAVDDFESIKRLIESGMNVARLNFSHGSHDEHRRRIQHVRDASFELDTPVAIMVDTKGPEIRTGDIADDGAIELQHDHRVIITTEQVAGTEERISVSYDKLTEDVEPGHHVFIADGLIDLEVERVEGNDIHCIVRHGGIIGSKKNVNVPGIRPQLPSMTEKDRQDILLAIEEGVDFIAASFIRRADNIVDIREILDRDESPIRIIAKIEDEEGLENIDAIIRVADGVMVARGDLGVQLSTEQIPMAQKRVIAKCNRENKPVITATQMLDSMIHNPNPTRAELTDVANAIFDGTDCVMLSGETASGKHPFASAAMLHRIAMAVELSEEYRQRCREHFESFRGITHDMGHAVAKSAYSLAHDVEASAIISPSLRGNSPRLLSQFRPLATIIAVTVSESVQRQLLLHWGVVPIRTEVVTDSDAMIQNALRLALSGGYVERLDRVVTAAGIPVNSPIMMNTVKVHFLGNILSRGRSGFGGTVSGRVVKCNDPQTARRRLKRDGTEIMITRKFTREHLPLVAGLAGIIVEEGSPVPPEEIQRRNESVVYIGEVPKAFDSFEERLYVSIDSEELLIYEGIISGE